MKKFLSVLLSVMMLASLFAVSASAAPAAIYEPIDVYMFEQDFQSDNADFCVDGIKVLEAGSDNNYVIDAKKC